MIKKLPDGDIRILMAQDANTLAEWWSEINVGGWPSALRYPEPRSRDNVNSRRWAIMSWIYDKVGHRLISRVWNDDMTDQEHEDFFRGVYEGDDAARARYDARLRDRVQRQAGGETK